MKPSRGSGSAADDHDAPACRRWPQLCARPGRCRRGCAAGWSCAAPGARCEPGSRRRRTGRPTTATRSPTTTERRPSSRARTAVTSGRSRPRSTVKRPRSTVDDQAHGGVVVAGAFLGARPGSSARDGSGHRPRCTRGPSPTPSALSTAPLQTRGTSGKVLAVVATFSIEHARNHGTQDRATRCHPVVVVGAPQPAVKWGGGDGQAVVVGRDGSACDRISGWPAPAVGRSRARRCGRCPSTARGRRPARTGRRWSEPVRPGRADRRRCRWTAPVRSPPCRRRSRGSPRPTPRTPPSAVRRAEGCRWGQSRISDLAGCGHRQCDERRGVGQVGFDDAVHGRRWAPARPARRRS